MKHKVKHNNEKVILAIANNKLIEWLEDMQQSYKWQVFQILISSTRKDFKERIFDARDTKENYYLLQLDSSNKIKKILSNPN